MEGLAEMTVACVGLDMLGTIARSRCARSLAKMEAGASGPIGVLAFTDTLGDTAKSITGKGFFIESGTLVAGTLFHAGLDLASGESRMDNAPDN